MLHWSWHSFWVKERCHPGMWAVKIHQWHEYYSKERNWRKWLYSAVALIGLWSSIDYQYSAPVIYLKIINCISCHFDICLHVCMCMYACMLHVHVCSEFNYEVLHNKNFLSAFFTVQFVCKEVRNSGTACSFGSFKIYTTQYCMYLKEISVDNSFQLYNCMCSCQQWQSLSVVNRIFKQIVQFSYL